MSLVEDERARADVLQERNRELLLELAGTKLRLRPNAIAAAKVLLDLENVDVDDQAALERALWGLRGEHGYLFKAGAADIGAGRKHHELEPTDDPSSTLARAYAEGELYRRGRPLNYE